MDKKLINKYREYAATTEAWAVLFVKKHLRKAQGHWVDITDSRQYEMSENELHFRYVNGGLFNRRLKPKYPLKAEFTVNGKFDERTYIMMVRAITWETSHLDIEQQKLKKVSPLNFSITGVSYDKNKGCKGFFRDDAPAAIKALEKDLSDRTNPLWDRAMNYVNEPEYVYKIKSVNLFRGAK